MWKIRDILQGRILKWKRRQLFVSEGLNLLKWQYLLLFRSAFENVAFLAKEPQNVEDKRYFQKLSLEIEKTAIVCKRRIIFAKIAIFVAFPISIRKCCIISNGTPKCRRYEIFSKVVS